MKWRRSQRKQDAKGVSVGLALGGGGVRGLAHAGVLSVFARERVPVTAIAGSSMGAIVGAAYALNPDFSKEHMLQRVLDLGLSAPVGLKEAQHDNESWFRRLRQFIEAEKVIIDAALGWGMFPEKLVAEFLDGLTLGKQLDEGRVRLAVVSIDLLSGDKVVFRSGPATFAVQASSALPGFLPPVRHGSRLLADGAFVDLVPVDVVRQMDVDLVVAVDVDQEDVRVEVRNGLEAFLRAVELCARHHKQHHLKAADLVVRPDFGEPINPLDASKAEQCVEAGVRAAEAALPELRSRLGSKASTPTGS